MARPWEQWVVPLERAILQDQSAYSRSPTDWPGPVATAAVIRPLLQHQELVRRWWLNGVQAHRARMLWWGTTPAARAVLVEAQRRDWATAWEALYEGLLPLTAVIGRRFATLFDDVVAGELFGDPDGRTPRPDVVMSILAAQGLGGDGDIPTLRFLALNSWLLARADVVSHQSIAAARADPTLASVLDAHSAYAATRDVIDRESPRPPGGHSDDDLAATLLEGMLLALLDLVHYAAGLAELFLSYPDVETSMETMHESLRGDVLIPTLASQQDGAVDRLRPLLHGCTASCFPDVESLGEEEAERLIASSSVHADLAPIWRDVHGFITGHEALVPWRRLILIRMPDGRYQPWPAFVVAQEVDVRTGDPLEKWRGIPVHGCPMQALRVILDVTHLVADACNAQGLWGYALWYERQYPGPKRSDQPLRHSAAAWQEARRLLAVGTQRSRTARHRPVGATPAATTGLA